MPAGEIPQHVLEAFKATQGKTITCQAAVAWEANKPLDITDIQVMEKPALLDLFSVSR